MPVPRSPGPPLPEPPAPRQHRPDAVGNVQRDRSRCGRWRGPSRSTTRVGSPCRSPEGTVLGSRSQRFRRSRNVRAAAGHSRNFGPDRSRRDAHRVDPNRRPKHHRRRGWSSSGFWSGCASRIWTVLVVGGRPRSGVWPMGPHGSLRLRRRTGWWSRESVRGAASSSIHQGYCRPAGPRVKPVGAGEVRPLLDADSGPACKLCRPDTELGLP